MVEQTLEASEPIPGYRLSERIGAGGYGVVWKADASGGLSKAIKFVYGKLDETRAVREMKALERIKAVRHPFLLSLERIEVVDGQLIVVTELADMCLMDRFQACLEAGLAGIPRNELLGYLRDASDALDYMSENFSLQHLDVKPENLLLVGGRIKVADFGLIKDLHELSASVIGGFTPIYAPPEAFDGRASRHSDQYSLAVLYQEMLTGVLPFPGKTAAQLTSQHLNSKPMLSPSPPKDRPILERALEKNPEKRFASCRELVEQLVKAGQDDSPPESLRKSTTEGPGNASVNTVVAESQSPRPLPEAASTNPRVTSAPVRNAPSDSAHRAERQSIDFKTQVAGSRPQPATFQPARRQALAELPPVEDLPPLDLSDAQAILRPTLLLGVGGTACQTLRQLRRRLHDQFGNLAKVPALRMLLLDTDVKALHQATQGEPTSRFDVRETMALPLRRPQDYRGSSKQVLKWLSRRWLYNIPRSLQTEGLRPLGRLAFSDHAGTVFDRLRDELLHLTEPEALSRSSEATGIEPCDGKPRIFVVASISGGTGGGMALDLAYAVRQILLETGRPAEDVHLVLAHSTGNLQGAKVMADVNAYAFLSELNHFTQNGGDYPGDSTCKLASLPGETARFPDSYLVHLGENLSETEFESATDAVAEFLHGNLVQASHAFFDRARQSIRHSGEPFSSQVPLRTFGIWQSGVDQERILSEQAESLCRRLLQQWSKARQETTPPTPPGPINPAAGNENPDAGSLGRQADFETRMSSQVRQLGLDLDGLCEEVQRVLEDTAKDGDQDPHSKNPSEPCASEVSLNRFIKQSAQEKSIALHHCIVQLIDSPQERIGGARRASSWLNAYLKDLRAEVHTSIDRLEAQRDEQARSLRDSSSFSRKLPSLRKSTSTGKGIADPTDQQRPFHQRILVLSTARSINVGFEFDV